MKHVRLLYAIIFLVFFTGCFEYEETIVFERDFSGHIDIAYIVPLKRDSSESLIRFLPTGKDVIESKISKGILSKQVKLQNYSFQILNEPAKSNLFARKAKVSYTVKFSDFSQMQSVILGSLFFRRKENSIRIKREFKTLPEQDENSITEGEKRIISESVRLLSEGYMSFRVEYPRFSEVYSTQGLLSLGKIEYKIPLTETIDKKGGIVWDYRIKILQ